MSDSSQDRSHGPTDLHPKTGDSTRSESPPTLSEPGIYHPTSLFRELLNRSARVRKYAGTALVESSPSPMRPRQAPGLLRVVGAAFSSASPPDSLS